MGRTELAIVLLIALVCVLVLVLALGKLGNGLAFVLVLVIVIAIVIVIVCVFVLVLVQHSENLAMGRAGLPQTEQLTRVTVNLTFFWRVVVRFLEIFISRASLQLLQHFVISNSSKAHSYVKLMKAWEEGQNMHL